LMTCTKKVQEPFPKVDLFPRYPFFGVFCPKIIRHRLYEYKDATLKKIVVERFLVHFFDLYRLIYNTI
jgi:hypothetical protein